jgi:hypothetical protein
MLAFVVARATDGRAFKVPRADGGFDTYVVKQVTWDEGAEGSDADRIAPIVQHTDDVMDALRNPNV